MSYSLLYIPLARPILYADGFLPGVIDPVRDFPVSAVSVGTSSLLLRVIFQSSNPSDSLVHSHIR